MGLSHRDVVNADFAGAKYLPLCSTHPTLLCLSAQSLRQYFAEYRQNPLIIIAKCF
jgi:hypothetical protein